MQNNKHSSSKAFSKYKSPQIIRPKSGMLADFIALKKEKIGNQSERNRNLSSERNKGETHFFKKKMKTMRIQTEESFDEVKKGKKFCSSFAFPMDSNFRSPKVSSSKKLPTSFQTIPKKPIISGKDNAKTLKKVEILEREEIGTPCFFNEKFLNSEKNQDFKKKLLFQ